MSAELDAVAFGERVLALLDQGSFTATYKYAVLLALLDVCLQEADAEGAPPQAVHPRTLARRVIELYWPQTAPYAADGDGPVVLRQISGDRATFVTLIGEFRARSEARTAGSLSEAQHADRDGYATLLDEVTWKLVHMPLPRLQRVGRHDDRFLYDLAWDDRVTPRRFATGDQLLRLRPGVGEHLVRLAGLIRPLVEHQWAMRVVALNRQLVPSLRDQDDLDAFLFGTARIDLSPVRSDLRDVQDGRCLYCGRRLDARIDVDHFLPWSRHPDNGIHNLVAAHPACNNRKRHFLAASEHVEAWAIRFREPDLRADLDEIARRRRWARHPERTLGVARAVYLRLPDDVRLWRAGDEFVAPRRTMLEAALGAPAPPSADRIAAEERPDYDEDDRA